MSGPARNSLNIVFAVELWLEIVCLIVPARYMAFVPGQTLGVLVVVPTAALGGSLKSKRDLRGRRHIHFQNGINIATAH